MVLGQAPFKDIHHAFHFVLVSRLLSLGLDCGLAPGRSPEPFTGASFQEWQICRQPQGPVHQQEGLYFPRQQAP